MKKEKNKDVTISALLRHIVPKAIGISPVYFVFMTVVGIAHGLFWGIDILIRQEFFDAAAGLPSGQTMLRRAGAVRCPYAVFERTFQLYVRGLFGTHCTKASF